MMEKKIKSPKQLARLLDEYAVKMNDEKGRMNLVLMSPGLYTELVFGLRRIQNIWEELNADNLPVMQGGGEAQ